MNFQIIPPQHLPPKILVAHAFVDGAYLRREGEKIGVKFPNPATATTYILKAVRDMGGYSAMMDSVLNRRTSFYDAVPSEDQSRAASPEIEAYWAFVDELNDTDLRFGEARGRRTRQKGVDVLLAVDMLVGAVNHVFEVAILISGDADFVPVVNEVRRRGISVVVGGVEASASKELRAAADRFVGLDGEGSWALARDAFVPLSSAPNTGA